MIVCLCKAVSDRAIRDAIGEGHTSFKALARRCGAGTGPACGGCHKSLKEMLASHGCAAANTEQEAEGEPDEFALASLCTTG